LIVKKGSIAIDGISLTVTDVDSSSFSVSIIEHTQGETTLTSKKIGDTVNHENDVIGKYVKRIFNKEDNKGISLDFLESNGF
jgi:riboflavin synthase